MFGRAGVTRVLVAGLLILGCVPAAALASVAWVSPATSRPMHQQAQALQATPMTVVSTAVYSSGGWAHVDGTITNDTSQALSFSQVNIALKDGGVVIGTYSGSAYGYRVGPGEQVAFGRSFLAVGVDASLLTAEVTASGIPEVDPLPVTLTEVTRSYAPSGGLRLYKATYRNDSPYFVEGPTLMGWELGTGGALLGTLFAHEWALIPPGGSVALDFTGYSPFALPESVVLRCQARPLGIVPPTTSISGVPAGWSRTDVTFTLTSADSTASQYYDRGTGLLAYTGPVTISNQGRTTVEYLSFRGGLQGPRYTAIVAIDKTAPGTVSNVKTSYRGSAVITLTARDALSGVRDTRYRVDWGTWRVGSRVVVSSVGRHTLRFYSRDRAGNSEHVRTVYFRVTR